MLLQPGPSFTSKSAWNWLILWWISNAKLIQRQVGDRLSHCWRVLSSWSTDLGSKQSKTVVAGAKDGFGIFNFFLKPNKCRHLSSWLAWKNKYQWHLLTSWTTKNEFKTKYLNGTKKFRSINSGSPTSIDQKSCQVGELNPASFSYGTTLPEIHNF